MTPKDHQSMAHVYPLPVMTSGARYSGVPINVDVVSSFLQHPKSTSFAQPAKSKSTFSGFRS
eukprot:CAMPEP_0117603112 /NCGR_PEP_ID=MMETSP0784-20121206/77950_1 /TAXON_ID=39447 /ORGANISM="" /LENGTH=61 /DNA_ID=CAMNT_0005405995 /DNA_START=163 /DNA_END=345 /DNA_ORIENTATION=+